MEDRNLALIFASVFAIGERALGRQSSHARSVNFGFVLANQSRQDTDILNSHFTSAIAKDVAGQGNALAERIDAKTEPTDTTAQSVAKLILRSFSQWLRIRCAAVGRTGSLSTSSISWWNITVNWRRSASSSFVDSISTGAGGRYGNRSAAEIADHP